jgi:serine/threonine protein kinase
MVKLSDFGISKELDSTVAMSNTAVGSYRYMSPERLNGEKYDSAGDIWSIGITVMELWEKRYPFLHIADTPISLIGELERISFARLLSRSPVGYGAPMREALLSMLEADPRQRAGAVDLISCRWFESAGIYGLVEAQTVSAFAFALLVCVVFHLISLNVLCCVLCASKANYFYFYYFAAGLATKSHVALFFSLLFNCSV